MVSIAGLDLPYGSQIQLTRTNYLVVNAASSPTAQGAANLLTLVQNHYNGTPLKPDYIVCDGNGPTSTDPYVIDGSASSGVLVPLIGPSQDALAAQSDLGGHANSDSDIGTSANGRVLGILGMGAVAVNVAVSSGTATVGTPTKISLATISSASLESDTMAELMIDSATSHVAYIDFDTLMAEVAGASLSAIDLSVANLNADFVAQGNAAGTTATTLGDVIDNGEDWAIVSVFGLVRVG